MGKSLSWVSVFIVAIFQFIPWLVNSLQLTRLKWFIWSSCASELNPFALLQFIDMLWNRLPTITRDLSYVTWIGSLFTRRCKLLIIPSCLFLAPSLLLYLILIHYMHLTDFFLMVSILRFIHSFSLMSWLPRNSVIGTGLLFPHIPHFNVTFIHFSNSVISIARVFGNWLLDVILEALLILINFSTIMLIHSRSWSEVLFSWPTLCII